MTWYSNWDKRIKLTVSAGCVDSNLSNFPIQVKLDSNQNDLFNTLGINSKKINIIDQYNNSCYAEIQEWDHLDQNAILWTKILSVPSSGTEIYLYYDNTKDNNDTYVGNTGASAAQQVWDSNFICIYHFVPNQTSLVMLDSTSNTLNGTPHGTPNFYREYATSIDINSHQGGCYDGSTYYYGIDTNYLRKFDSSWNVIAFNSDPNGDINKGTNHMCDGSYYDGKLYFPAVGPYPSGVPLYSRNYMAVWDASDLSLISTHSLSAAQSEVAGSCIDPNAGTNGIIYTVDYFVGNLVHKFDLVDFSYLGYITLTATISNSQGITKSNGFFYITESSHHCVWKVKEDGTILGRVWQGSYITEGIDSLPDGKFMVLIDPGTNEQFHFIEPAGYGNSGVQFDGAYVRIALPDVSNFKPDYVTIEAFCKTDSGNADWSRILDRYLHPNYGYALLISNTGKGMVDVRCTGSVQHFAATTATIEGDTNWHSLAGSYGDNHTKMYDNGNLDQDTTGGSGTILIHQNTQIPYIGDGVTEPKYKGQISELRLSKIDRSDAWKKATSYSNWNTLLTYGATESYLTSAYSISGSIKQFDSPVSRKVRLYRRYDGELQQEINSEASSGTYSFSISTYGDEYFIVAVFDEDLDPNDFNALVSDQILPTCIVTSGGV